ncbi:hypothetical protein KP509_04G018300 [Ceratopteris richardii]|uniref:O-fucosyltransferase family protein n=1 Tax=Ceratopteris richardii TaxID=49495 RepID=A0A8T2UY68_CERRI|nr:hypothetical protein KP509_04G018300 [Ceratopteris richardii]
MTKVLSSSSAPTLTLLEDYRTASEGSYGGGNALSKKLKVAKVLLFPRSRMQVWLVRLSTSILVWTCLLQLLALGGELWRPYYLLLHGSWPPCLNDRREIESHNHAAVLAASLPFSQHNRSSEKISPALSPRSYVNNGYLLVSCNGGLNQMRAAICDMVAVARLLNLTLIVPELDKTSFWNDPSDFGDIFDTKHFIASLRDELRIIKEVPEKFRSRVKRGSILSLPPVSWSNESYYLHQILPLIKKHKIVRFSKTDARVANSGFSEDFQKLRCRVNYKALQFTPHIEELGSRLIQILQQKGPFLVLHLRYEMDMLAFSGCTHGCTEEEEEELTRMRYAYPWWKEKIIDSKQKRLDGLCPLTPEETLLILRALGYGEETQIYIAAGEIYGSDRRMASLHAAYPNIVRKEMLLSSNELRHFQNHSSQMAALDYLVAIESDAFMPTYDGNMAKLVEGHRRYLGFRKTILLDRKRLVQLIDEYQNGSLEWKEFSLAVQEAHKHRMGKATRRRMIPDRPKEEDYFYANPEECLP